MTNKITKETIKKLVEEVLSENQRLDEKTSADLTKWEKTKSKPFKYKQSSFTDDNISPPGTSDRKVDDINDIAAADGTPNNLSVTDIEDAINGKVPGQKGRAKTIKKKMNKSVWDFTTADDGDTDDGDTDDGDTDDGDTEEKPKLLPGDLGEVYRLTDKSSAKDFKKAAEKAFKSVSDNSTLQAAKPAVTAIRDALKAAHPESEELEAINKGFKKLQARYAPLSTRDRGALGKSNAGIKAGDRKYTQMYSDPEFDVANVGQTTGDARGDETTDTLRERLSGFTSVVDSSALAVADLFGGTAGTETELLSLTKNLRTVVEQIASIGRKDDKTKSFSGAEAFKFAAQANFIFQLFNAGKMAEGKQAGYDFERFCGLLFGGVVSGKANGAVDVVTASKNGFLRMSQKFVNKPDQIKQNYDNTKQVVVTQNTPIYYMSLIKGGTGGAASYDSLDMYVIKLEKNGNKMKSSYLDSSGNFKTAKKKVTNASGEAKIYEGANPITFDLGLSSLGSDPTDAAEKVANKIASSSSEDVKAIHEASTKIYQLSKNMLRNTEEYRAVKGGSKGGASTNPMDYLNQLSLDYDDLKTNYKDMFAVTGDAPTQTRSGMKGLTEQKITSNFLKKLIAESFKK